MPVRPTAARLLALLLLALPPAAARGQMPIDKGDGSWISPDTGREFNNPTSAYFDSALLRRQEHGPASSTTR